MWLCGDMIIRLMSPQLFLKWVSISDFLFQFLSPWEMSNFISGQMSALQIHSCCSSIQNTSHTHRDFINWQSLCLTNIEFHTSQWLLRVVLSPLSPARCQVCPVFDVWIFLTICGGGLCDGRSDKWWELAKLGSWTKNCFWNVYLYHLYLGKKPC